MSDKIFRRTKVTKFFVSDENYVRRNIFSEENFVRRIILSQTKFSNSVKIPMLEEKAPTIAFG